MNKTMSNELLLKLASLLWKLPKHRFNYNDWVGYTWKGAPDLSCGMTACALGWAATMPEFNALGLCLIKDEGIRNSNDPRAWDPVQIASRLLGLKMSEARLLFIPDVRVGSETSPRYGAGPRTVSRHIRRFVMRRRVAA